MYITYNCSYVPATYQELDSFEKLLNCTILPNDTAHCFVLVLLLEFTGCNNMNNNISYIIAFPVFTEVTFENLKAFIPRLLSKLYVEALVYGNVTTQVSILIVCVTECYVLLLCIKVTQ